MPDTVETIIAVENEVLARIEAERQKATAWLAGIRRETELRLEREHQTLDHEIVRARSKALLDAQAKAARIVEVATMAARRLGELDETFLGERVQKHLRAILDTA